MSNKTLELIAKLLAAAEGAATEAEADRFNDQAQQIAARNSIDVAHALHLKRSKESTVPIQRGIVIGVPGTEGLKTLVNLYLGVAAANDIRCLIAQNSTRVYAIGYEEDIDVSEALYGSLVTQMTGFVTAYRKEDVWKKEEVWAEGWYSTRRQMQIPGRWKQINWRAARLNFQQGFAERIAGRLFEVTYETRAQRIKEEKEQAALSGADDSNPGTALVLASKGDQVRKAYRERTKGMRSHWDGSLGGQRSHKARRAGASAAENARLGSATPLPGARKGIEQ
jgi:hypothetical protein